MSRLSSASLGWMLLSATLCLSGCASWSNSRQSEPSGPAPGQCTVELKPVSGAPQAGHLDLPPDATVQFVLEKTKANRKYSRATVELYRKLPSGEWHKMPVEYDSGGKKVDPLHDYHVQPGDRVVVSQDTTSTLDDMMKKQTGPLSGLLGG